MAIKISGTTVIDDSRNLTNINSLPESTWIEGISPTETVVSPAKIKAAVEALVPTADDPIGVNQSWGGVSLSSGSARQNTTGRPIQAAVTVRPFNSGTPNNPINNSSNIQVSSDGSSWVTVASTISDYRDSDRVSATMIIPSNHYYRYNGVATHVAELS